MFYFGFSKPNNVFPCSYTRVAKSALKRLGFSSLKIKQWHVTRQIKSRNVTFCDDKSAGIRRRFTAEFCRNSNLNSKQTRA